MSATERLDQWAALADEATPGPWDSYCTWPFEVIGDVRDPEGGRQVLVIGTEGRGVDSEFAAAAREAVPALIAALRAVLFQCSGDGDNVYRDDNYGTGSRVICVDVIEAAIASALGVQP